MVYFICMKETMLSRSYMIAVLAVITIIGLIVGKQILIPLILGLFLSLSLSPVVSKLQSWKIPKTLAIIISFLGTFLVLGIIGVTVGFAVNDFVNKLPIYTESIGETLINTKESILAIIPIDQAVLEQKLSESIGFSSLGMSTLNSLITTTTNIGSIVGLTIVITFLILFYRDRIRNFIKMIAQEKHQASINTIAHKSFSIMPRYLTGILTVVTIMTVLNTLGFMIIGIPSPLFWGLIVSMLNIIPYIGPIIGFGAATIFSLLVAGPTTALFTMGMFLVIQFIDNNFLTPMIAGGQININALAAIISLIVCGMIWGAIGMVLALPILGLIKIICDEVPELHPIGYLIGDKE